MRLLRLDDGHHGQAVVADKQRAEQLLRGSASEWTAVRPPILNDGPATGKVEAATGAILSGMPAVSRADTASFIYDELDRRSFVRQSPVVYAAGSRRA